jgi:hypothetical protein
MKQYWLQMVSCKHSCAEATMVPLLVGVVLPPKPEARAAAATIQRPVYREQHSTAEQTRCGIGVASEA